MGFDDTLLGSARIRIRPDMDGFGRDVDSKVGSALKSAAKVAAGAFVVGMGAAVVGVKAAVDATSDLNESANAVRVTFGDAAGGIAELGKSSAKALGLSTTEFNGLAVRFSNFATTVAGSGGDVTKVMQDLTGRAADFASVMNLDVAEAAELFQSGLAGETEPLRKYGIDLSAAAVEAYALSKGINDGTHELTEAEKVQARYGLLMESTNKTAGDFANTQGGLANQSRILSSQWENLKAVAGDAFTPLAETIMPKLNEGITWMIDGLTANMPQIKADMAEFGTRVGEVVDRFMTNWPQIQEQIKQTGDGFREAWPDIKEAASNLGDALQRVGQFAQVMFDAYRSLPPEAQKVLALLAVAQKTGALSLVFKGADAIKGLVSNITAAVVNVNGPAGGVPGGAPGAAGKAAPVALAAGAAAGVAASYFGGKYVTEQSMGGLRDATSAAAVYQSALEGARAKQSEVSKETARTATAQAEAARAAGAGIAPLVAQAQAAGSVAPAAAAMASGLQLAAVQAGITAEKSAALSQVFATIDPAATIGSIPELLMYAGQAAGLSAEEIGKLAPALIASSGAAGVAAVAIGQIAPTATLSRVEIDAVSTAVNSLPVGANATLVAQAIQTAGLAAGMTQEEIDTMTASVNGIPPAANLPALQMAIAVAGQAAGLTQDQVDAMSAAVAAVPPGATAAQMGEAIRVAGVKARLTDEQIQGVTAAARNVPPNTPANVSTNAPEETGKINALQAAINSLSGKTVDVGVKLSGSTGGGTGGGSTFSGATSGISGWMDGQVAALAEALAPGLMGVSGGAYAGPGGGVLGRPLSGYVVSSEFQGPGRPTHMGIDLAAPMGTGVFASAAGLVQQSGWNGGYGNFIAIDHGLGIMTTYGHMSALLARAGQIVGQGNLIGQVGSTGDSTGPHLHFETKVGGQYVNPRNMVAFDRGGYLQPGWSAVYNGTGKPEPVFTDKQWKQMTTGQVSGHTINVVNHYPQAEPTSVSTSRALRLLATAGGL